MKCNCKTINNLSPSERNKLKQALNIYENKYLQEETDRLKLIITNNLLKVITVACNDTLGIGKQRLCKVFDKIYQLLCDCNTDECFFEHVDKVCLDVLGKQNFDKYFLNEYIKR